MTLEQMQAAGRERTEAILGAWTEKPTGQLKELLDNYKAGYKDITKQLEAVYTRLLSDVAPEDYYNVMFMKTRLESLLKQTADAYTTAAKGAAVDMFNMSETAMSNTYYQNMYSVNWFADPYFTVLDPKAIEVSVYGTDEIWASIKKANRSKYVPYLPQYGTLSSVLESNASKDLVKIKQAITGGIRTGKSYSKVAKDLQKIFNTTASNAIRIARTEGNRNLNAGSYANTQAAVEAGIEMQRMYVATQDTRTRQQSAAMDGQKVDADKPFKYGGLEWFIPGNSGNPAYDINDRCTSVDLVADQPPLARRGRNPVPDADGKYVTEVADYSTVPEWMDKNGLVYNHIGMMVKK